MPRTSLPARTQSLVLGMYSAGTFGLPAFFDLLLADEALAAARRIAEPESLHKFLVNHLHERGA